MNFLKYIFRIIRHLASLEKGSIKISSKKVAITLAMCSFAFSGCSTMFNSGSQSITAAATNGKEVKVTITTPSGTYMSKLPTTIVAEPSTFKAVSIQVQDDCYDPIQMDINRGITPSYWANIFNFYGFIIDPLTGAMWKYNNLASVPVTEKKDKPVTCKS